MKIKKKYKNCAKSSLKLKIRATLLKRRFGIEGPAFLHRIVAIDETWLRDFEPELKSESNEWRCSGPRDPKNLDKLNQRSNK